MLPGRREDFHRRRWRVSDMQFAEFTARQRADSFHRFLRALEQLAHFLQIELTLCGKRHPTRTASDCAQRE